MSDEGRTLGGARQRMVEEQLVRRGIHDRRVLDTMRAVPRHAFVPPEHRDQAYDDRPASIGHQQTISQPYVVAYMTQALGLTGIERVLEVGTGSGYQTAVLAELAGEVFTVEIVPELAQSARRVLDALGYGNIHFRVGDGHAGWPEAAPFDRILVTAAPERVPAALVDQCAAGGRIIVPVGTFAQRVVALDKTEHGIERTVLIPVRFVPMTGRDSTR